MNIKCLITPIVLIFTVIVSFAHDNARVKVEYTERYKNWTGVNKNEKMLLLANGQISHYYNPTSLVVDSILSTPEGTVRFNAMVEAANEAGQRPALLPGSRTYIIKNANSSSIHYYGEPAGELGDYEEQFAEQNWTIADSSKTVLGYDCLKAEMDYHGRHWTVWFTPEIPISDGPWKLCGLPGLILEADADNGKYHFEATGIESVDATFPQKMYGHDLSVSMKRKDMLSLQWKFYNNSGAQMQAEFGITAHDDPLPEGFDLIETDYR